MVKFGDLKGSNTTSGFGSDSLSKAGTLRLAFVFFIVVFLSWVLINIPQEGFRATVYIFLGLFAVVGVLADVVIKKKEYIDTILEEPKEKKIIKLDTKWLFLLGILITIVFTYRIITVQQSLIDAPIFAVVPFTDNIVWKAFLSGLVGLVENTFFFSLIFASLATAFSNRVGAAGIGIGAILTSIVFLLYHFAVYGISDLGAAQAVLFFAGANCLIVYLFKSLIISDIWHFSNNFLIGLGKAVSISLRVVTG